MTGLDRARRIYENDDGLAPEVHYCARCPAQVGTDGDLCSHCEASERHHEEDGDE